MKSQMFDSQPHWQIPLALYSKAAARLWSMTATVADESLYQITIGARLHGAISRQAGADIRAANAQAHAFFERARAHLATLQSNIERYRALPERAVQPVRTLVLTIHSPSMRRYIVLLEALDCYHQHLDEALKSEQISADKAKILAQAANAQLLRYVARLQNLRSVLFNQINARAFRHTSCETPRNPRRSKRSSPKPTQTMRPIK